VIEAISSGREVPSATMVTLIMSSVVSAEIPMVSASDFAIQMAEVTRMFDERMRSANPPKV
jgi:hypothetical protein